MTLEEMLAREAIRKTIGIYNEAVDHGDRSALERVFTEDALMIVNDRPALEGRNAILAALNAGVARPKFSDPGNFQRHNLASAMINVVDSERASARTHIIVISEIGLDHTGIYNDVFRRVANQWLIAERRATVEWVNPSSRFTHWLDEAKPVT